MPTVEVEIWIDAPPSVVWELVTDIDLPARFSPEFQGAEWTDPAAVVSAGATFRGRNRNEVIGDWEVTCTVTSCEEPVSFGWLVGDADAPAASWRFSLEPERHGTQLRQWAQMGPGRSGVTLVIERDPDNEERLVERRIEFWRSSMHATVAGIKDAAERNEGALR